MGEAKNRGTKIVRMENAKQRKEAVRRGINNREHAPGLVWLVIQMAPSEPFLDHKGAFVTTTEGKMLYRPKPDSWIPLLQHDTPEWVKDPEIINKLRNGEEVSLKPEEGGMWYRGIVCKPNDQGGKSA